MFSRKTISYGMIALAGVLAPFQFDASGGKLRLQQACSQATGCVYRPAYICSTFNADHNNYECSSGCGS
jgi:hypothetical protein